MKAWDFMKTTLYAIADPHFEEGSSSWKSPRNVLPLCIGLVAGFASYGIFFGLQMMNLNNNVYTRHNDTLQALNDRLLVTIKEKEDCLGDNSLALKVAELQGKLAGRIAMANKYDNLLLELEAAREMVERVTKENISREQEFYEHRDIIGRQASELEQLRRDQNELRENEAHLVEQNDDLNRQVREVDALVSEWRLKAGENENQVAALQERTQQRENFLCREEYGDGPYYVQVSATMGDNADSILSFILELASRRDMPHSVYTFLSLVRYGMFDNSAIIPIEGNALFILPMDADGSFDAKRHAVGMAQSILRFEEWSPAFPCEEGSLKFHDFGPFLALYLSPVAETTCFGKIVKGIENVRTIQDITTSGQPMKNVNFQYLKV